MYARPAGNGAAVGRSSSSILPSIGQSNLLYPNTPVQQAPNDRRTSSKLPLIHSPRPNNNGQHHRRTVITAVATSPASHSQHMPAEADDELACTPVESAELDKWQPCGGLSAERAQQDATLFPVLARNNCIQGMSFADEGEWTGPWCFVQAADTQLGMMANFQWEKTGDSENWESVPDWTPEVKLTKQAIDAVNRLRPRPRFFVVCGDLIDAMPGVPYRHLQTRDFKALISRLHPSIRPICVCGNHDIGNQPTEQSINEYRQDFGDDYFEFWCGGCRFVVVNSQLYQDDSLVKANSLAQAEWLETALSTDGNNQKQKHLIGFQHVPPFIARPDEEAVDVFGDYRWCFNFADKQLRRAYLDKLKAAGMSKLFCGHYHRNAGGWDDGLEVVVTSAIGCQLGGDGHGLRLVKVLADRIEHAYYTLDNIPSSVRLDDDAADADASSS